jgi:hypothetical protein
MNNPHRARLFILQNCSWIHEIRHNPEAAAPCQRWMAFNHGDFLGQPQIQKVAEWTDGQIVKFARKLKKEGDNAWS